MNAAAMPVQTDSDYVADFCRGAWNHASQERRLAMLEPALQGVPSDSQWKVVGLAMKPWDALNVTARCIVVGAIVLKDASVFTYLAGALS